MLGLGQALGRQMSDNHGESQRTLEEGPGERRRAGAAMRYLIYNFCGLPGDLYQLVPDKFLATLCAVLNRREARSARVWDRGNLLDARRLLPGAALRGAMRRVGGRLFENLERNGTVPKLTAALFGAVNALTDRRTATLAHELIDRDAEGILAHPVEAVFLNLRHGPGFRETVRLADKLRQARPDLRILAIGHRASWFARDLAELYDAFDAFVIGPSSYDSMVALAEGADPSDVPNTAFRRNGRAVTTERAYTHDLGDGVIPSYDPEHYIGIEGQLPMREIVLANEACPFSCNFCVRPPTYGTRWRARDVSLVVDEIEHRVRKEGIRCFRCSDSTPPRGMLTAVANEIVRRGLDKENLHLSSFGRANRNLREDYVALRQAGFDSLFFGIESGCQRVLDEVLGKKLTVAEAKEAISEASEAGLAPVASFMFPTPGETQDSRQQTLDLLAELRPYLGGALVTPSGVYPHTAWHRRAAEFDISLHEDYVSKVVTYPIDPLKPIRFWPPFPFSYKLMGKEADQVGFRDIAQVFTDFARQVWNKPDCGGLGIPNVQDYGIVLAGHFNRDPAEFSAQCLKYMVTRDLEPLADLVGIGRPTGAPSLPG